MKMEEQDSMREFVFLSYAKEDLQIAIKVYNGLKDRGLDVWFDEAELRPGRWKPKIKKAISHSKYFVICISTAALKKTGTEKPGFQDEELQYAYEIAINQPEDKFTIVPVRLEDCDRGDHRMSIFQQYDIFPDIEKGLDKLAVILGGVSLSDASAKDERTEDEKMISGIMCKGATFYYSGEYNKSLEYFDAAISLKKDYHKAWNIKGAALGHLGRHEDALKAFDKATEIKPDFSSPWVNKGNILLETDRCEEAIEAFKKAIEINPDSHLAWYNKGVASAKLALYEEAIEAYDNAIKISPDFDTALTNKSIILNDLKRFEEAIETCNKLLELKTDHPEGRICKGVALVGLGRNKEALNEFERVIVLRPDNYEAWHNKVIALHNLGQLEEAFKAYENAKKLMPHDQLINQKSSFGNEGALLWVNRIDEASLAIKKYEELFKYLKYW